MKSLKIKNAILALLLSAITFTSTTYSPQTVRANSGGQNKVESVTNANLQLETQNNTAQVLQNVEKSTAQEIPDEEGVVDYVREQVNTTDAMPSIESSFSGYRLGGVQTIANDGHIGIPVELSVYYMGKNAVTKGPNGTPIVLYVVNTLTVRTGTKSDVDIISSMLFRGYVVAVLNYKFNSKAVPPALEWSAQAIRNRLINGEFFGGLNYFTSGGTYYETFIVPAGYDVSLNHVYFEFDKHGADGTFDKIVEVWNNDFRKAKGETVIKWVYDNGSKKPVQNDFDANTPVWCNADGTTNENGQYIKIKFTKAQSITDCVKKDGSPLDLNLYMHLIYPTNPKKAVPVMALNSSAEHLAKGAATLDRPQVTGFAFNGYASVMFDFGYTPMARDDHYGFFKHDISGDSLSYAVHFFSDKKIGTAAMRYIRYLSLSKQEFNFDTNAIGVFGNSKGGWMTYLGEEHPEVLAPERILKGHHGETRYENGDTQTVGVIDGGAVQPWLTYNGQTIDSGADFIYASCGGLEENMTYGHAPTYVSCNLGDPSCYTSSNGFVNMCRIYDIPCLWFEVDKGHTLASSNDIKYGIDTYPALYDFANFYLKKEPVKLLYTDLKNGASDTALNQELFFMFSGGVSRYQIEKLTPVNANGEKAQGEWTSCYGGTWWTFSPKLYDNNQYYTVTIDKSFYGTNKVRVEQEHKFYFKTKYASVTQNQFVTTSKGTYAWFTVGDSQEYILRAYVKENANNRLLLYSVSNFNSASPDNCTIGTLLQEKVVYKSGNVQFDLTEYCKNYAKGTTLAFLLKQSKTAQNVQGMNIGFDNGNYGGVQIAGKILHEASTTPDGQSALKIVEMQPNTEYTEEFYNNITTVCAKHGPIKAGTNGILTTADVGRRFKLSFRVYDTFSRTMQVYIKYPTSEADGIRDYNWSVKNFYTEPNKWVNVEFDYVVYEPSVYPDKEWGVPSMLIKANAWGNVDSPFYLDSFSAVEIIDDVIIESVSIEGAKAPIDFANIPSSESIANNSISAIAQKSHPYILYENSEISALKEKIKSGYSQKAFAYITKKVKSYKNATISVYYNSSTDKSNGIIGRQLQSYVAYLGTYGVIAEDNACFSKAVELVMSAVNSGNTDIYYSINGALCVADFGYAYSLAYDWLYNYLSVEQRNLLKAEIEEIGAWIYNLSTNPTASDPWGSSDQNRKAWNWNAVTHGSLGMIALSLSKESAKTEWLTRAIDRIKDYYTYAVDTQGCAFEGLHYIGYALNTLTIVEDTIYNLTGLELLDYYSHFYNLTNWAMRMTAPYGNEQASVGQGTKLDNYATTFYIINKKHQRLELWGWERTYNLHNGGGFVDDYAGNGFNAPNIIFFEDQSLTPQAPIAELPLVTSYDKGLVIAKDGWQEDSSMMTFFSGWGYQGCWNHPDNNTFTFFAKGESFVIDLGANYKTSLEHNIVQVDGVGFYYDAPNMIVGSINANKSLTNWALYLKGVNSDSYRDTTLTESTRQMIYMGGQTPYVIAFDYVYAGTSSHTYTTNFFTDFSSTISIENGRAKIVGANTGAEALVYALSTDSASLSTAKTDKTLALVTTNNAVTHKQATVFITKMPNGKEPTVTKNIVNGNLQVSVSYINNNTETTDTYTFYSDKEVEVYTSKHTHDLTRVQGVDATCTSGGSLEYYLCSGCNRKFADSLGETLVEDIQISALGHSATFVQATQGNCKENGYIAHYYCSRCNTCYQEKECINKVVNIQAGLGDHNYGEWIDIVEPTQNSYGTKGHYHCDICGKNFDINHTEISNLQIEKLPAVSSSSSQIPSSANEPSSSSSSSQISSSSTISSSSQESSSSKISYSSSSSNDYLSSIQTSLQQTSSASNVSSVSTPSNNVAPKAGCSGSFYGFGWLVSVALISVIIIKRKKQK